MVTVIEMYKIFTKTAETSAVLTDFVFVCFFAGESAVWFFNTQALKFAGRTKSSERQPRVWLTCVMWSLSPGHSLPGADSVRTSRASLCPQNHSSPAQPGFAAGFGPVVLGGRAGAWVPVQSPACAGFRRWTDRWAYGALWLSLLCGCSFLKLLPFSGKSWSYGCPCAVPSTQPASPYFWRQSGKCHCRCPSTGLSRPCWGHLGLHGGIHKVWAFYDLKARREVGFSYGCKT